MRRIGIHLSISGGIYKSLERAMKLGVNTLQIFLKSPNQWDSKPIPDDDIEKFNAMRKETDILVFAHTGYLVNLAGSGPNLGKSVKYLRDDIDRASCLGIKNIVVHPGNHMEKGIDHGIKKIAESIDAVFSKARPDVNILLETTAGQGSSVGHRFEQIRRIIDLSENHERLGVCLDTCHVFTAGYDLSGKIGVDAAVREFDTAIGLERLCLIHLNDSKKGLGSNVDRHENIGEGMIGAEGFSAFLNHPKLKKVPVVLETPKFNDDEADIKNLAAVRKIVRSKRS